MEKLDLAEKGYTATEEDHMEAGHMEEDYTKEEKRSAANMYKDRIGDKDMDYWEMVSEVQLWLMDVAVNTTKHKMACPDSFLDRDSYKP